MQSIISRVIADAVGILETAALRRSQVKGGDTSFLEKLRDAATTHHSFASRDFLLQNGQDMHSIRSAIVLLGQLAPRKLDEVRDYIQNLLVQPTSSTSATSGATE